MSSRLFYRSLATATKSVRPPVQLFGIDGTYASALYTAAAKESSIDKAFQSLSKVREVVQSDKDLAEFLVNPASSKEDRSAVIDALSSSLKLDKSVGNFLNVLAENNRLTEFEGIFSQFSVLNDAYKGVVEATVTSAKPLDSKTIKRLQTAISKSSFVGEGKTLNVTNNVEPDLLGGLVVEVGDRTVDLSVSGKIAKLNQALNESV
ncbi:ATP synthase subunit 5, mitochondrial [[Candida] railenensis]|uniref:ATP synthase subunit 5, mitochondrial n=1 Tax=[Candida] railenensis TaxID=45579 RepID=A0A9P0QRH9_9ASCO|nr:ATP synthase subunit 5, mitochondrial [[Candida] railenensis]